MMRKLARALPATLSLALVACGGGPDIEKVKADFNSPTGSVQSKDGMVAASGSLDASTGVGVLAGGGVPGASLTAEGKLRGFDHLNVRRTWERRAEGLRDYLNGVATREQALRTQQLGGAGCTDSAEAQAAFEDALGDIAADIVNPFGSSKKFNGKASYKQDLSSCSGGDLSGTVSVDLEIEAEVNGEVSRFAFTVKYGLANVCEVNTDEQACLDGALIMEAEAIGSESFGSLTFTSAWEVAGSWLEAGVERNASLKGGIRSSVVGEGDTGTVKIEVINYVTTPEGKEWSYVWEFEGAFNGVEGTASIKCRGSDGSVTCTINSEGGMCSASDGSSLTWTSTDEESLDPAWFED